MTTPSTELLDSYSRGSRAHELLKAADVLKFKDWNGHNRNGAAISNPEYLDYLLRDLDFRMRLLSAEDLTSIETSLKEGSLLGKPVTLSSYPGVECTYCGKRSSIGFDGTGLVLTGDPCPHPNGLETSFEINVPSGKLAIANDLREWFPITEPKESLNLVIGCHETTMAYAAVGMAHAIVGNSCPSVYQDTSGKFRIASYSNEVWSEKKQDWVRNPKKNTYGKKVASICTDLWWYSICDYEDLIRRADHYTKGEVPSDVEVVDVEPGVYRFVHDNESRRDGSDCFAHFERVRDPDPVVDHLSASMEESHTALECCIQHAIDWPTLSGFPTIDGDYDRCVGWEDLTPEQKLNAIQNSADQFMCVLGGGVDWHENGFVRTNVSDEARRYAAEISADGLVPLFNGRYRWYPISEGYGGLCLGAEVKNNYFDKEVVDMNPSFVHLGLNVARNIVLTPEEPRLNNEAWPPVYEIHPARERMRLALRCYEGFRRRYPDVTPPDATFDALVEDGTIAKSIEDYDFGPLNPPREQWRPEPKILSTKPGFFELDASKMPPGGANFCLHPKMGGCWASKENAQRLAIDCETEKPKPGSWFEQMGWEYWHGNAGISVPLKTVGRIIGPAGGIPPRLEIAFDYGTKEMVTKRWVLREEHLVALTILDEETYQKELKIACERFLEEEQKIAEARKTFGEGDDFKPTLHLRRSEGELEPSVP